MGGSCMSGIEDRIATTTDWLDRAMIDLEDARTILASRDRDLDNVAFLCRQSVEKLIKGFLVAHGVGFPKIHDIARLLDEFIHQIDADLADRADAARNLNVYAVASRYPEFSEAIDPSTGQLLVGIAEDAWALFEPRIRKVIVSVHDEAGPGPSDEASAKDADDADA